MSIAKEKQDLSAQIKKALDKATQKVIAETKAKNSYMVIAGKNGSIKKIPAKDL